MKKHLLQGLIKRHPDGFGFFIPDEREHPDVYIPKHSMQGIMTNDRVVIDVMPEKGGDRFRGEIIKILSRGCKTLVGRYFTTSETYASVADEGKAWGENLRILRTDSMNASEGDLVAVEILSYPGDPDGFKGRVKEVIGDAMDPLNDIRRVIHSLEIPLEFSPQTLVEAKSFKEEVDEKDFKNRKDLRKLNFITIDGVTAKDFDDAIYVETNAQGFKLWVAIADVSHYVRLNTAIDNDAYERGTSVYFPNFVIPMLPEVLSNGLCSLKPHVPRLALVAEMQMNFEGEVLKSQFYEAVIESQARVTYGEAQETLDGSVPKHITHVAEDIHRASDLAKILMAKRFREGSLDLEIPETEMEIDASGMPIDIIRSERLFAHRLIEELMLAANVAVAKFLASRDIPALYRIHEPPNLQALHMLQGYLENFGSHVHIEGGKLQKKLTKALQEFHGKPQALVLSILTLRSMSQAKYSSQNLGHFGLGFDFYTHFTSPIRRYPDLIVHRLLKNQVIPNSSYHLMSEDDVSTAGNVLSACEQKSVKAERQLQGIKKARFMSSKVGEEFSGIISSVAKFGVFVLLREFDVDGLIRTDGLSKERMEYDEENLRLVAPRSGLSFSIGDILKVKVMEVDPELGQINFALIRPEMSLSSNKPFDKKGQKKGSKEHSQKRGGQQKGAPQFSREEFKNKKSHKSSKNKQAKENSRDSKSKQKYKEPEHLELAKPKSSQFSKTKNSNRQEPTRSKPQGKGLKPKASSNRPSSTPKPGKLTLKVSHRRK